MSLGLVLGYIRWYVSSTPSMAVGSRVGRRKKERPGEAEARVSVITPPVHKGNASLLATLALRLRRLTHVAPGLQCADAHVSVLVHDDVGLAGGTHIKHLRG